MHQLGGRVLLDAERPLHPRDIVPRAELPADPPVDADRLEAHRSVQARARLVRQRHTRDRHQVAARREPLEQRLVQRATRAGASPTLLDVDADLAREAIGRSLLVRPAVCVADDAVLVFEHDPCVRARRRRDAFGHLRGRRRLALEADGRLAHVRRVDRRARRRVVLTRISHRCTGHVRP